MSDISYASLSKTLSQTETRRPLITARSVGRFCGLAFGFAAIGLWLIPSNTATADVLLMKTGLTAILSFCSAVALIPRVQET